MGETRSEPSAAVKTHELDVDDSAALLRDDAGGGGGGLGVMGSNGDSSSSPSGVGALRMEARRKINWAAMTTAKNGPSPASASQQVAIITPWRRV